MHRSGNGSRFTSEIFGDGTVTHDLAVQCVWRLNFMVFQSQVAFVFG